MTIQISTYAVENFARELIFFPLFSVESEDILAHKIHSFLFELFQVFLEEVLQAFVQFEPNQLSSSCGSLCLSALAATANSLTVTCTAQCWLLVHTCAVIVNMSMRKERKKNEGYEKKQREDLLTCRAACNAGRTFGLLACRSVWCPLLDQPISLPGWCFLTQNCCWSSVELLPWRWPCLNFVMIYFSSVLFLRTETDSDYLRDFFLCNVLRLNQANEVKWQKFVFLFLTRLWLGWRPIMIQPLLLHLS